MSRKRRQAWARNAFITLFLGAHVALAATCPWRDAKTWGWQMFANATIYSVAITRLNATGIEEPVAADRLASWLSPRAFVFFRPAPGPRNFHRGRGLLLDAAARVPAFLCRADGSGRGGFSVRLEHREVSEATARAEVFAARCGE